MSRGKSRTQIGGQAVLEGVMMRGAKSMALSVRDADGIIRVETYRPKPIKCKKIPIVRGIVSFVQSLFGGTAVLMRSADVYGEGEPTKFEKWLADKLKVNVMGVVGFLSVFLGLALSVFLFIFLPQTVRGLLEKWFNGGKTFSAFAKNFIEGGIKLLIFLAYLLFCSLIKDVRRTFMYHGAEHKTISCYESGLELTPENAKKCTRVHDRCGTTFIFFVMLISIIVFAVFESILSANGIELNKGVRILCKLALLPLVAGLSYELLKALSKTKSWIFYPLKAPGLLLQRITTKEPTLDMLEVAISSFNEVLKMDEDETIPEKKFTVSKKRKELTEEVYETLKANGIEEKAEAEWIVACTLNVKRSQVYDETLVSPKFVDKVNALLDERIKGRPLWYCVGDTEFYGYKIKVDERVLIPRPETEILVENALKEITGDSKVLDLCTGSGVIAIAVSKEKNVKVCAVDVSHDSIELASENAKVNGANVEFIVSDMFDKVQGKFDVILSNPPYIKSEEIDTLQREVKDFEPRIALDGGADGLDFYRVIAKKAKEHLTENGIIILECGENQARDIEKIFSEYEGVEIIKDLEGIERVVKVR